MDMVEKLNIFLKILVVSCLKPVVRTVQRHVADVMGAAMCI